MELWDTLRLLLKWNYLVRKGSFKSLSLGSSFSQMVTVGVITNCEPSHLLSKLRTNRAIRIFIGGSPFWFMVLSYFGLFDFRMENINSFVQEQENFQRVWSIEKFQIWIQINTKLTISTFSFKFWRTTTTATTTTTTTATKNHKKFFEALKPKSEAWL